MAGLPREGQPPPGRSKLCSAKLAERTGKGKDNLLRLVGRSSKQPGVSESRGCGGDSPGAVPGQAAARRGAETLRGGGSRFSGGASPPRSNRVRAGGRVARSPSPASSVHPAVPSLPADFAEGFCSPVSGVQRGQRVTSPGLTLLSSISDFVVPWDQLFLTHKVIMPGDSCL